MQLNVYDEDDDWYLRYYSVRIEGVDGPHEYTGRRRYAECTEEHSWHGWSFIGVDCVVGLGFLKVFACALALMESGQFQHFLCKSLG